MINPFRKSYSGKELNLFRYLSRIKVFEKLSYREMSLFLPYLYLREYKMDEVVYFRNDPSNALYMVKSGKVSLNVDVAESFEQLKVIKSGVSFGENALLDNTIRLSSAIVVSERSELYVLPHVYISEVFESHIIIKAKMLESLCEQVDETLSHVYKAYKSTYGFFSLGQVFKN
jgi:CRP-like cAMP-binding protein